MPYEYQMELQKEIMVNESKKILESINMMSLANLDDQQVYSLMMIKELARGIVHNKIEKVTASDVKKAQSHSIDKMVGSCKAVKKVLSYIDYETIDDPHSQSVSRMKEIVSSIVTKGAKVDSNTFAVGTEEDVELEGIQRTVLTNKTVETEAELRNQHDKPVEQNNIVVETVEQNNIVVEHSYLGNAGIQAERVVDVVNEDGHIEGKTNLMDEPPRLGNGETLVGREQCVTLSGGTSTCSAVQAFQPEELIFEDAQFSVKDELRTKEDQKEMEETFTGSSELERDDDPNEGKESVAMSPLHPSVIWPADDIITLEWVKNLMFKLEHSSKNDPPSNFRSLVPISVVDKLFDAASRIMSQEPNCVEVDCHEMDSKVVVVGDIHGQFHDLLNLFRLAGLPSEKQFYVFNGDYVDRGAWGLEVIIVLFAWKVLMPERVYLLRGNHETGFCTSIYGFKQEVKTKFADKSELVYKKCLECFKDLPLASIISSCVYTAHGGLFRSLSCGPVRRSKRNKPQKLELGSLEDLSRVNRFFIDVPDEDPSILNDVLWSDPSKKGGIIENAVRGVGVTWGPDCTEAFLKQSNLKLIIRSHEGPDARDGRDGFEDMLSGYSTDHVEESGKLYTLFSAPNYPQFGEINYKNEGAYAVLKPPNFESPSFHQFKAIERPEIVIDPFEAVADEDGSYASEEDLTSIYTSSESSPQTNIPDWLSSRVDFEALGIYSPPSWNILMENNSTGRTKFLQVPRAPLIEGLPLPSHLQEPYKGAFEYLFELIAALKCMVLKGQVTENGVHASTESQKRSKRKRRAKRLNRMD
ncbi:serine/threonine-protein phosphatase 7 inactive homolog isoform X1 [Cannabis sativa]|uniref:serine/threonine-protein phosphatase 7 inactive homolog isoform X1 n=1 Tax=Cannabis sativa TaxID=3483 RepID=UPI0029CA424E|nr:serine/threonine-protein phosphatase 7 inactive homolog isoform X1 [Cannabis sativa]